MVSPKRVASELRRATTVSIVSLAGLALAAAAVAGVVLVFVFAEAEERRDLRAWEDRLGIVAETRAAAVDDWIERQYGELAALAENASLQLYMTELARAGDRPGRVTEELAEAGYLRNLLAVVADRAGYLQASTGPDIDANVDRVGVSGIALVGPDNRILVATRGMPPLDRAVYAPLLASADGARGFLDIRRTAAGTLALGFSVPVHAVQAEGGAARPIGRIVGVRTVADGLFPLMKQPGFAWKTAETHLVRRNDGMVEYLTARRGGRAPLTGAREAAGDGLVSAIAVRETAAFGVADDYAGELSVFSARRLTAAPWTVVVKVGRDEVLGAGDARRNTMVAVLLTAIALVAVGFVAAWRHGTSVRARAAAERYRDMAGRYEAQSSFLRLVADSQPHPMFILDGDGRFRFANRAAAERAETSDADMIGKSIVSVYGAAEARRYTSVNEDALASGEIVSRIHRSGANGDLRVVQAAHIPVDSGPDFDAGVLVVEQDITGAVSEREHREAALRQLVRTLLALVDSRDPYAANHSMQVATVARAIAEEMGLDETLAETAETAGSLMNVGKLLVPTEILTRPGTLQDDEMRQVRESIESGVGLLADVPFAGPVVETLRQMTERWDGTGHPRGLSGAGILVTARIVAVANAFVALLSSRAWRPGADFDQAVETLLADAGKAFDRAVVAALINRLENRGGRTAWASLPASGDAAPLP